jgi:hypothetical protein
VAASPIHELYRKLYIKQAVFVAQAIENTQESGLSGLTKSSGFRRLLQLIE